MVGHSIFPVIKSSQTPDAINKTRACANYYIKSAVLENAPIDCLFFQLCPKIMATTGGLPYREFWVIKGILELFHMVLLANFRKWSFKGICPPISQINHYT